ncbi:hypothetical protein KTT66_06230 [Lacticaseibacillus casei]|uniref:Uncharacterized protein n=1 Tax=Lacticaseibacillus huelsenbergensis TaxID=3035291 RepID=A0ABY8DSU8_9LACO|nr:MULTISPECIES: hypothetical protein [Lacticaseibacillus]MDG3061317.1 hypothetical protein [Lacticaseibacillus sp. BCRC 81376]QVI38658.1 hypothetical protein KGS74_06995 [Lacticaseibacillus casei]QXG60385.1 hypothetical protein KTT66_06230 [Lacticaseibacillus casei]WFB38061.1 hypothetical protein LHUE1_001520 [Lacticaseibacillus huelsenbergensis]WFB42464.1 hypothetical protein LHUE2_000443 [Lacticaseibacillus huelsenbergensis]
MKHKTLRVITGIFSTGLLLLILVFLTYRVHRNGSRIGTLQSYLALMVIMGVTLLLMMVADRTFLLITGRHLTKMFVELRDAIDELKEALRRLRE